MIFINIALALSFLVTFCLLTSLVCFFMTFYSRSRKELGENEYDLPKGEIYEKYKDSIIAWAKEYRTRPHVDYQIKSFDGLMLSAKYYELKRGAPLEILFHGYRGTAERDMSAGIERCFALGRNALIVSQRASLGSEGHVITFGIKERRDCLSWVDFAISEFGKDVKIILTGISMGASTVLSNADEDLPPNVACIFGDCGFSSAKDIIKKVIRDMHLPAPLIYPFVRLGARIFGGFDLEEKSPLDALKNCKVPVILIHGESDSFVPCEMSRQMYEACSFKDKAFHTIKGAGHGICYPVSKDEYIKYLGDFADRVGFLNNSPK